MKIGELKPADGATTKKVRVGRGIGSGIGGGKALAQRAGGMRKLRAGMRRGFAEAGGRFDADPGVAGVLRIVCPCACRVIFSLRNGEKSCIIK